VTLLGNTKDNSFTGDCEGKVNYYRTCRKRIWRQVSLSVGAHWGKWGGVRLLGILRDSWWAAEGSILLCGSSVRGTWGGAPFLGIRN